jgi:tetratricopeptide (TPR) repeat protein
VAQALQDLAGAVADRAEQDRLLREALAIRRSLTTGDDAALAWNLSDLAGHLLFMRQLDEAERLGREAVDMLQRTAGERHPRYLAALSNLAAVYNQMNALDQAAAIGDRLLEGQRAVFGPMSFQVANTLNARGVTLATAGRFEPARQALDESYRIHVEIFGEAHWRTANTARNIGRVYELERRYAEALSWLDRAATFYAAAENPGNTNVLYIRAQMGPVLLRLGRGTDAERLLTDVLARLTPRQHEVGPDRIADVRLWLGRTLVERKKPRPAIDHLSAAVAHRERVLAGDHPRLAEARCELGRARAALHEVAAARELLAACLPIYRSWGLADPVVLAQAARALDVVR